MINGNRSYTYSFFGLVWDPGFVHGIACEMGVGSSRKIRLRTYIDNVILLLGSAFLGRKSMLMCFSTN